MHEISALLTQIAGTCPRELPPFLCVDQEGGRVARLGSPVLQLPPMAKLAAIDDPALTRKAAQILGKQLLALGFTMDFAPVLDVDTNPSNPVIGDRAFGATPEAVIRHAGAFADGLREAGLLSCGKHFPGHGDTELDSHLALPVIAHDEARLERVELAPFRALCERLDTIMTAHIVFTSLNLKLPATLSYEVVSKLLKGKLAYRGVVISDDLEMKAIVDHHGVEQAACAAIEAGCDALLICSRLDWLERAADALAARAREDTAFAARLQDAAERCLVLRKAHPPQPVEPAQLESALDTAEARHVFEEIRSRIQTI
jgi:beta-N-acetylhexosaminidase